QRLDPQDTKKRPRSKIGRVSLRGFPCPGGRMKHFCAKLFLRFVHFHGPVGIPGGTADQHREGKHTDHECALQEQIIAAEYSDKGVHFNCGKPKGWSFSISKVRKCRQRRVCNSSGACFFSAKPASLGLNPLKCSLKN